MLVARGVVVSVGHSMATLEQAQLGIEAGVSYGTHLFNAMPSLAHREPGLVGALLAHPGVTVGVIADGVHVHPTLINIILKAKGPARVNLVSDAIAALGMPPGNYRLGNAQVISDGKEAHLADGTLAGSVLSMDQAVRNLVEFTGCLPSEAMEAATAVPAAVLGLDSSHGRIAPGGRADLTLLDPGLRVVFTIVAGEMVYSAI
jgi:N-acetylglucosamine-6-phosphate deacetylase